MGTDVKLGNSAYVSVSNHHLPGSIEDLNKRYDKANFKTAIRPASVDGTATGVPGLTGCGCRSRVIEGDLVRRGYDEKPRRRNLTKLTR